MMKRTPKFAEPVKGDFIGGAFSIPEEVSGEWTIKSPAAFSDVVGKFKYSFSNVDRAIESAHGAFKSWRSVTFEDRAAALNRYAEAIKKREEALAEAISRETGKPLWESKSEVSAMVAKVQITLGEGMRQIADYEVSEILPETTGVCRYRPLGVMAVVGPFNFPGHLPNGHIVPALATGNTVIFKPSEKTPLTGQIIAECFEEATFPPGVFNLIQGDKEVGRRLCVHEGVAGVLFTGSYEVGTRIKQDTLQQHWKILALEMGGKNSAIVWEDADIPVAVFECLVGAYITAGQRCSATSRILVHRKVMDQFLTQFHRHAKSFSIGHPFDNPFMGPLIDQGAVDRYQKFQGIASREGCEILMRGKTLEGKLDGNFVTPSICLVKTCSTEAAQKSVYQQTELFAPNVAVIPVDDKKETLNLANATQYGLVASVFTSSRETYRYFWDGLEVGLVNWNRATTGASSKLPFGGLKKSGNHFPTAVSAARYCTYPVSCLEVEKTGEKIGTFPGLNW